LSKFNTTTRARPAVSSPVTTERTASGRTFEGGAGYARDVKSELFLLAVTNMVGEQTFYETGAQRDDRYEQLVQQSTLADPEWTARMLGWLRGEGNLRSAALVGAAVFAKTRLDADLAGLSRQVVASVLQRPDEPGELLAYWTSRYGRAVPKPVKRGVADAVQRLYTERALLKYDTDSKGYRFADVLELVHATPSAPWQGDLFKHAIDRRHCQCGSSRRIAPRLPSGGLGRCRRPSRTRWRTCPSCLAGRWCWSTPRGRCTPGSPRTAR